MEPSERHFGYLQWQFVRSTGDGSIGREARESEVPGNGHPESHSGTKFVGVRGGPYGESPGHCPEWPAECARRQRGGPGRGGTGPARLSLPGSTLPVPWPRRFRAGSPWCSTSPAGGPRRFPSGACRVARRCPQAGRGGSERGLPGRSTWHAGRPRGFLNGACRSARRCLWTRLRGSWRVELCACEVGAVFGPRPGGSGRVERPSSSGQGARLRACRMLPVPLGRARLGRAARAGRNACRSTLRSAAARPRMLPAS